MLGRDPASRLSSTRGRFDFPSTGHSLGHFGSGKLFELARISVKLAHAFGGRSTARRLLYRSCPMGIPPRHVVCNAIGREQSTVFCSWQFPIHKTVEPRRKLLETPANGPRTCHLTYVAALWKGIGLWSNTDEYGDRCSSVPQALAGNAAAISSTVCGLGWPAVTRAWVRGRPVRFGSGSVTSGPLQPAAATLRHFTDIAFVQFLQAAQAGLALRLPLRLPAGAARLATPG
jgi:hypothetical protein